MTNQGVNQNAEHVDLVETDRSELVEKYEALQRLLENEDFKVVVTEGYLKESAIHKTSLLATNYVKLAGLRNTIYEELAAISCFESYLRMLTNLGAPAIADEDNEIEG